MLKLFSSSTLSEAQNFNLVNITCRLFLKRALKALANNIILKIILTYFVVASIIFLSDVLSQNVNVPTVISILLLIPFYIWCRNYSAKKKLSKEIDGRNKGTVLFWIFALFILALSVRIPSVVLFNEPFEKTPLIFLLILTVVLVEKADVSAFGFKTRKIGKALLYGLTFYVLMNGLIYFIFYILAYAFTNQMPIVTFDVIPFLFAMPFMVLCVAISEEGFFRGYVQTHLEKFYSPRKAIFVQAFLFGIWHFVWNLYPFDLAGMIAYMGITFFVGLFFGYFYSKTRNLVPLIFAHGFGNSILEGNFAIEVPGTILLSDQFLSWVSAYVISAILTFLVIKHFVKEI
jgi:membrane protease YdiL (CAAX protease family)